MLPSVSLYTARTITASTTSLQSLRPERRTVEATASKLQVNPAQLFYRAGIGIHTIHSWCRQYVDCALLPSCPELSRAARLMSLEHRFGSLAARIQLLEQQLGLSDSSISHAGFRRWQELQLLQQRQLHRIGTCEDRLTLQLAVPQKVERVVTESASIMSPDQRRATAAQESTQTRLSLELTERGITSYRFRRAPADYYEQRLEYRKQVLQAESTSQLCKSLVLENTRARSAAADAQHAARYFCVVIQYGAKLHAEKVRTFLHKQSKGVLGRKQFNMRLANEDESEQLTGFGHNAVTPIGMRTSLPILLSHHIADLKQGFFWMGGGETDLKLGLMVLDFIRAYGAIILDCTHED